MPLIRIDKFIAARTSSNRDTPSATSAASGSAPDDWVWRAMDIARRAAMANDLEHVPSIKAIAEIFTRMLERLQGMKKNRDEFYVITSEIGSFIESAVRYAKERRPVSERYKVVCDEFLSAISSMQSEMEQIFGKRSPKAKAYQTVLSSYQFRVRSLHGDVQALTLSSPLTSSTGILSNSRDTTITGGTFTEIQGNQYIFHSHVTADIRTFPDQTSAEQVSAGRIDDLDFSDVRLSMIIVVGITISADMQLYRLLKYGDLRAISVPRRDQNILPDDVHEQDVRQEYSVRIQDQIMTARTYRGNSALQSFKDDVKLILEHNFRHPHILQLFGMCSSSKVPTLVFHGELKDLNQFSLIGWGPTSPDGLCRLLQIFGECQTAFYYLMREHQLHDSPCDFLTQEGQFIIRNFSGESCALPSDDIYFSNCSCRLYVDNLQHLQVSIEAPRSGFQPHPAFRNIDGISPQEVQLTARRPGFYSSYILPKLPPPDVAAIKTALVSRGTIPDGHHIDKKACLLAIYDFILSPFFPSPLVPGVLFILISPMRCIRAARLTFNHECRFTWSGWDVSERTGQDIKTSRITVDNFSWRCFMIPNKVSIEPVHASIIRCSSTFDASRLYSMIWLAQSERIISQIKLKCSSLSERIMALVTRVERNIFFQSYFSPSLSFQVPEAVYLFVQDLQDVDDVSEIRWFWAKDSEGLERLSPADMLVLGLGEPRQSKIFLWTRNAALDTWEDLRIFHKMFGFAPGSLDVSHFLDLPVASVEWDGDDDGPLTPSESLVWDYFDYKEEIRRLWEA